MKTLSIVIIALCAAIQLALTQVFIRLQRTGRSKKSLLTKMICATAFVLIGLCAALYADNTSRFAMFMLIGLGLSWLGDLFLHMLSEKKYWFVIGFFAFLSAHIVYIVNYVRANRIVTDGRAFGLPELLAVAAVLAAAILALIFCFRMKLGSVIAVPIGLYGLVLTVMAVQAVKFCVLRVSAGDLPGGLCVGAGAVLFFISDFTIAPLIFGSEEIKKNYPLKCVNMWTYFIGQSLLALSLMFVNL